MTPEEMEAELRREWWLNHGCEFVALYGDDGEMSCGSCGADFRRFPMEVLRLHVVERRLFRGAEAWASIRADPLIRQAIPDPPPASTT